MFGEALFEDGKGFGGGGHGGGSWSRIGLEIGPRGHLLVTLSRSKPGEYTLINWKIGNFWIIPYSKLLSDDQAALRRRLTEVLRAMGPLGGILVHVCLCDEAARTWASSRGDTPQAGVVVLRLALDALGDYWKL